MTGALDSSNVVAFPPRGGGFAGPGSAIGQAAVQLATLAQTILLLEAEIERGAPLAPAVLDASRRFLLRMKDDVIRIATSLQAGLSESVVSDKPEPQNKGHAELHDRRPV